MDVRPFAMYPSSTSVRPLRRIVYQPSYEVSREEGNLLQNKCILY